MSKDKITLKRSYTSSANKISTSPKILKMTREERLSAIYTMIDQEDEALVYQTFKAGIKIRYGENQEKPSFVLKSLGLSDIPPEEYYEYYHQCWHDYETIYLQPHLYPKEFYIKKIDKIYKEITHIATIKATTKFTLQQRLANLLFIEDALKMHLTWDYIRDEIFNTTLFDIDTSELRREIKLLTTLKQSILTK